MSRRRQFSSAACIDMDGRVVIVGEEPEIWRVTAGVFTSNCYLVALGGGRCAVIDPGLDGAAIVQAILESGLKPSAVLCTHGHFDHVGSAALVQRRYECPVYLTAADLPTVRSSNFLLMAFKIDARIELPQVTQLASGSQVISCGGLQFVFHPAPGHTPGSCVIETGGHLFTGDTLYARGVGLSKLPGEKPDVLRSSLRTIWNCFSDATVVHPGHGESSTFGAIKRDNIPLLRFLAADK
jgi:hydroxyacylglutathione hydrolase